eukprot:snap_masked-scaffold117_size339417-processed-gene-2.5 protein:Tk06389 transcript:snap_masked-scaffold117_size339417-processed-gene-2.5-mRNA-1 annotation:"endoribonuclease dcr-1"
MSQAGFYVSVARATWPWEGVPHETNTPLEPGVEAVRACVLADRVLLVSQPQAKTFLLPALVREVCLHRAGVAVICVRREKQMTLWAEYFQRVSHASVAEIDVEPPPPGQHWSVGVVMATPAKLRQSLEADQFQPLGLLIIDDGHAHVGCPDLGAILDHAQVRHARVVTLTANPLHAQGPLGLYPSQIQALESFYPGRVEAMSEPLSLLRSIVAPQLALVEFAQRPEPRVEAENIEAVLLRRTDELLVFLGQHRHALEETYGEEFRDLLEDIPDPTVVPIELVRDYQSVVRDLGVWAAERAAILMAIKVDKLKTMEKYERQFLLLSCVHTEMLQLREICGHALDGVSEQDKLTHYVKPKMTRLVEILLQYKPSHVGSDVTDDPNAPVAPKKSHRPNKSAPFGSYNDPQALRGIVYLKNQFQTKTLFHYLKDLSRSMEQYSFLCPQYVLGSHVSDQALDPSPVGVAKKREEDALRKFRLKEVNVLLSSDCLEMGVDSVRCNLVVLFDSLPNSLKEFIHCKIKAKYPESIFVILATHESADETLRELDVIETVEKDLISRSSYQPKAASSDLFPGQAVTQSEILKTKSVELSLDKGLWCLNRYCSKLPSDTFTRLSPIFHTSVEGSGHLSGILLPINSPVKDPILGSIMPNPTWAKKSAALKVCQILYESQELDENLFPTGKDFLLKHVQPNLGPLTPASAQGSRAGPRKQRHYYYKTASKYLKLEPVAPKCHVYALELVLQCPIPDDQNTRGRKLFLPERAEQSFGFLTSELLPASCPFPIYTRSGEVLVKVILLKEDLELDEEQRNQVKEFHHYTFSDVLRLEKYPMAFNLGRCEINTLIVPLKKVAESGPQIDWDFLRKVVKEFVHSKPKPKRYNVEEGEKFQFDRATFQDAVVMPWYRNQDQPQYFYVAEIYQHLSPKSDFPGQGFESFEKYYKSKYDITISDPDQPLLDVDHTSARLNFLTPRYVTRKGISLPTSSEETKRNKRENLEQKQILVPELCAIHPFRASLWRQMVALPCIFYRLNSLLNADALRVRIASEAKVGKVILDPRFQWEPMDFGWTLNDVLKTRTGVDSESAKVSHNPTKKLGSNANRTKSGPIPRDSMADITEIFDDDDQEEDGSTDNLGKLNDRLLNTLIEEDQKLKQKSLEIGTWSNEMAAPDDPPPNEADNEMDSDEESLSDMFDPFEALPDNLTFLSNEILPNPKTATGKDWGTGIEQRHFRVGSPTFFRNPNINIPGLMDDSDGLSCSDSDDDMEDDRHFVTEEDGTSKIEFRGNNMAEAIEDAAEEIKRREILEQFKNEELELIETHPWVWEDTGQSEIMAGNPERATTNLKMFAVDKPLDFQINNPQSTPEDLSGPQEPGPVNDPELASRLSAKVKEKLLVLPTSTEKPPNTPVVKPGVIPRDSDRPFGFSFDYQPDLATFPGPSPSLILQALTMSNANDAINLERLETIGDSFLKYAITSALFLAYPDTPEGRLSHLRSKQVSNFHLYHLGWEKNMGECMITTKFEPHDNWLPPGYYVPKGLEKALIESGIPSTQWNTATLPDVSKLGTEEEILSMIKDLTSDRPEQSNNKPEDMRSFVPYNLLTQQSIPDKSIADCVEALIGAYLIAGGKQGALGFMAWLGMDVDPMQNEEEIQVVSPLNKSVVSEPERHLSHLLQGFEQFEHIIGYSFRDKSYLLQAFTHTSYYPNRLTDCYQRLEFLGDAVLDFLITRHLYEDPQKHSPGALTDLRSALVNNTIFAIMAVKFGFHKFLLHLSPGLQTICHRFVKIQSQKNFEFEDDFYLVGEGVGSLSTGIWNDDGSLSEVEDVEVPKALGDVFESVAGAVFLDSGLSLDTVWRIFYRMMGPDIKKFMSNIPKSPIRELLELEPETAKFTRPERLSDGRRVRVSVDVFGKGTFKGVGRNYRIAKCTAAKCALRAIRKRSN